MRKIILALFLVSSIAKVSAFEFGVGALTYVQFNNTETLGLGLTFGLGSRDSNTFVINALIGTDDMNIFKGTQEGFMDARLTFDWHALAFNVAFLQFYLGAGVGINAGFNADKISTVGTTTPLELSVFARLPVGLKIFIGSMEVFGEVAGELGWMMSATSVQTLHECYWAFPVAVGVRLWL